jgi:AcrR family transcriptional regulator
MTSRPPTAKGEATRQRILDAATAEFAQYGIAGARVDRIAAASQTNKAQIYAYVGNKDALFETVFSASLERIMDVAPINADDVGDWAVRLYDEYLKRPDLVSDGDRLDAGKISAIGAAQEAGAIAFDGDPFDVMALVISMSMAWSPVSGVYAATADEAEAEHDRRRAILRRAVERAFMP